MRTGTVLPIHTYANPHWWCTGAYGIDAALLVATGLAGVHGRVVALAGPGSGLQQRIPQNWYDARQLRPYIHWGSQTETRRAVREILSAMADQVAPEKGRQQLGIVLTDVMESLGRQSVPGQADARWVHFDVPDTEEANDSALRDRVLDLFDGISVVAVEVQRSGVQRQVRVATDNPSVLQSFGAWSWAPVIAPQAWRIDLDARVFDLRQAHPDAEDELLVELAELEQRSDPWTVAWNGGAVYQAADVHGVVDHSHIHESLSVSPHGAAVAEQYAQAIMTGTPAPEWWCGTARCCCLDIVTWDTWRVRLLLASLMDEAVSVETGHEAKVLLVDANELATTPVVLELLERLIRVGRKYALHVVLVGGDEMALQTSAIASHIGQRVGAPDGDRWSINNEVVPAWNSEQACAQQRAVFGG